MMGPTELPFLN